MKAGQDNPGGIAAAVRALYERHPYPGPAAKLVEAGKPTTDDAERRAEHHLFWPGISFREERRILVAGCGTVQAVRHALRWPAAQVVGIDFSAASIEQSRLLKERHGLANLELRQLPVERAQELGQRFDQVICTGVLHHLADPDAGLAALREVLAPQGAMHLMLYAPYGRAGIYMLQNYCRRLGIGTSSVEIGELVTVLKQLPSSHPLWPLLRTSPDFQHEAGLADALLHPQDRPYSVPEMLAFAARNKLRFGRWIRQAPYLPHCGSIRRTPHFGRIARMEPPGQYAAMELFRGAMLRHSAIFYRQEDPPCDAIPFDDRTLQDCRPLRLPDTICVDKAVAPGEVGVLINRRHTDTDIYLPVTEAEKRLWSAMDGRRPVRDLVGGGKVRPAFFETLWRHDQIVLDISATSFTTATR